MVWPREGPVCTTTIPAEPWMGKDRTADPPEGIVDRFQTVGEWQLLRGIWGRILNKRCYRTNLLPRGQNQGLGSVLWGMASEPVTVAWVRGNCLLAQAACWDRKAAYVESLMRREQRSGGGEGSQALRKDKKQNRKGSWVPCLCSSLSSKLTEVS